MALLKLELISEPVEPRVCSKCVYCIRAVVESLQAGLRVQVQTTAVSASGTQAVPCTTSLNMRCSAATVNNSS
jgi:hypothetical protein